MLLLVGTIVLWTHGASAQSDTTAINSECSRKASELGLTGAARVEFRAKCKAEAATAPQASPTLKSAKKASAARESKSLKNGSYVLRDISCDLGSNASTLTVRGAMLTGGRFCAILVKGSDPEVLHTKACPEGEGNTAGDEQAETISISSTTQFVFRQGAQNSTYRYCSPLEDRAYTYDQKSNKLLVATSRTATKPAPPSAAPSTVPATPPIDPGREIFRIAPLATATSAVGAERERIASKTTGFKFTMIGNGMEGAVFCSVQEAGQPGTVVKILITGPVHHPSFVEDDIAHRTLNDMRVAAKRECLTLVRTGRLMNEQLRAIERQSDIPTRYVVSAGTGGISGYAVSDDAAWVIQGNWPKSYAAQQREQARFQQQAALERQRVIEAKTTLRNKFATDFKIQAWVDDQRLATNPFIYKNQVVAVQTVFGQMLSENEAIFADNQLVLVSGVPPTLFAGKARVFLAIRVSGTKPFKTATGEVTVPYGEYVGVYACQQQGCNEFVGQ